MPRPARPLKLSTRQGLDGCFQSCVTPSEQGSGAQALCRRTQSKQPCSTAFACDFLTPHNKCIKHHEQHAHYTYHLCRQLAQISDVAFSAVLQSPWGLFPLFFDVYEKNCVQKYVQKGVSLRPCLRWQRSC